MPRPKKPKELTTILIDADIPAFSSVSVCLEDFEWTPDSGLWATYVNMTDAKAIFKKAIEDILEAAGTDKAVLCITGSRNFRKDLLPTYKGVRPRKPPGYREFQTWIVEESGYQTFLREGLEGDDCLGILATAPVLEGRKIIWSIDKDLMQIPCTHMKLTKPVPTFVEVSERDGELLHVRQTLTGDTTDNYKGLVGFGPVAVEKFLEKHKDQPLPVIWEAVETEYVKRGFTREDMLVQARCARILRGSDYDFTNKRVILWSPPENESSLSTSASAVPSAETPANA